MTNVRMTLKLEPEIMKWVRQEAKKTRKSMASIVVGAMERYRAAEEYQQQLLMAGLTAEEIIQQVELVETKLDPR